MKFFKHSGPPAEPDKELRRPHPSGRQGGAGGGAGNGEEVRPRAAAPVRSAGGRARCRLSLSFQSPLEVPGVSNTDFLRTMCNELRKHRGEPELDPLEFYGFLSPKLEQLNMDPSFLARNVNEGFSGGEKKRNEILQLAVMESERSILDESDSGLDVDALRDVAKAVNSLREGDKGLLLITHYQRLLDAVHPDFVHVMQKGKIVQTGDISIASKLEEGGFASLA